MSAGERAPIGPVSSSRAPTAKPATVPARRATHAGRCSRTRRMSMSRRCPRSSCSTAPISSTDASFGTSHSKSRSVSRSTARGAASKSTTLVTNRTPDRRYRLSARGSWMARIARWRPRRMGNARSSSALPMPFDCAAGSTKKNVSPRCPSRSLLIAQPIGRPSPSIASQFSAAVRQRCSIHGARWTHASSSIASVTTGDSTMPSRWTYAMIDRRKIANAARMSAGSARRSSNIPGRISGAAMIAASAGVVARTCPQGSVP